MKGDPRKECFAPGPTSLRERLLLDAILSWMIPVRSLAPYFVHLLNYLSQTVLTEILGVLCAILCQSIRLHISGILIHRQSQIGICVGCLDFSVCSKLTQS